MRNPDRLRESSLILDKGSFQGVEKMASALKYAGFTLIEMLVVLAIIVLMMMLVLPSITSYFQLSLNSANRELATTIQQAYNAALLTGNVYRMVYDLKEQQYWVEYGPPNELLSTKESIEKEKRKKRLAGNTEGKGKSNFSMDTEITRKKTKLPVGVEFQDIITEESPEPFTEGQAFTHFFPHGVGEQTIIHLKDSSKHHATLSIQPLLGKTDAYDRYVEKKDLGDID